MLDCKKRRRSENVLILQSGCCNATNWRRFGHQKKRKKKGSDETLERHKLNMAAVSTKQKWWHHCISRRCSVPSELGLRISAASLRLAARILSFPRRGILSPAGAPTAAAAQEPPNGPPTPEFNNIQTNRRSTGLISIDTTAERINDSGRKRAREMKCVKGKRGKKWSNGNKNLT